MRLEVATVDAQRSCPVAAGFVLSALDAQLPHHSLHEWIRKQMGMRERFHAQGTFFHFQLVHACAAHGVT
jgi:hypothetical protein